jgi:hypothetical protein
VEDWEPGEIYVVLIAVLKPNDGVGRTSCWYLLVVAETKYARELDLGLHDGSTMI